MAPTDEPDHDGKAPTIVAITASAAGTASLERLLERLPARDDAVLVLALQQREALDEAGLRGALVRAGHDLVECADGSPVEAGRLYLPGIGIIATLEAGHFHVRPTEQAPSEQGIIDSFLVSLAREAGEQGIVVALAGTDGDGTLGVREVKKAGGLTLAEETPESRAGELAQSDSPAALADAVLPVDDLAARLVTLLDQRANAPETTPAGPDAPEVRSMLATVASILRQKTGHDFHGYKPGTFLRRVQRRMQVLQVEGMPDYIEALRARPGEAQDLFNDLLIGVTEFFRDPREWAALEREIVPKLFERKTAQDQLRIWVVGCSTGEEAYSLAILLAEHRARLDDPPGIQIFASDLDGRALASARAGRYRDTIAAQMSPDRLGRWFVREGDTYHIVKELREMCIFSQHSLIKDAPFSKLDLISCRNLLIYLDSELQERVIPLFHFALKPAGFLFLGNSENASRHQALFEPIEPRSRIFRKLDTARRLLPDFPLAPVDRRLFSSPAHMSSALPTDPSSFARRAERIADRHAPAHVIIDVDHQVLHFSDRMGPFITPMRGAATLNLLSLVHPDLRLDLRTALSRAADERRTVQMGGLSVRLNGHRLAVDLIVEPVREEGDPAAGFVVLFRDGAILPGSGEARALAAGQDQSEHVQRLEEDLRATRDRLQATIEELESTNEELKSSNEEYQSLNEEMQSANEELETSKEELQSINEELTTVNGELAHRVQELGRANSDLKNFLESTQIATLFLDNELRVTNFTPAAVDLFHLIESDQGRPIGHLRPLVVYEELQDDARRVLRTLTPIEREIQAPAAGAHYIARVLPYRSTDNVIAGVVLTFVDVTARRQAEQRREAADAALRDSEERFRAIIETARDYAIFTTDAEGRIETWPKGAEEVFGWTAEEALGQSIDMTFTPEDRTEGAPEQERSQAREAGQAPDVRWHLRKDGRRVFIEGVVRPLDGVPPGQSGFLKIGHDVTERHATAERLQILVAELQHRTRNLLTVVGAVSDRTAASAHSFDDYLSRFRSRLGALGRVNSLLSRLQVRDRITFDQLIQAELKAHGVIDGEGRGEQVRLSGPGGVRLRSSTVQTFALALHELATNALKYGALSRPEGRLEVRWNLRHLSEDKRHLHVEWLETGGPIPNQDEERPQGYGRRLIEQALPYQLGAETT